ncbi:MAG: hypothetical protein LUF87_08865 [Alistipes sp.]|nr:hypothetical protein [Alistipes sp.]
MSLKDKGNAWKLVYAALVMVEDAPKIEEGYIEDDEGNLQDISVALNPKDLKLNIRDKEDENIEFWEIDFSDALQTFVHEYEKGKIPIPFSYEYYLHNEDIIETIEAYGLNVEKFWFAIVAIYWLTQIRCMNVLKPEGNTGEQMRKLSEYLQSIDSFTITAEGKKKLVINDVGVIRYLQGFLDELIVESDNGFMNGYSINHRKQGDHLESTSVQMWFAAERYLKLFENLELPTIRAIGSEVKYKDKWDKRNSSTGGNKTVSYNKMLLISRLMYFTKLTRNENFLYVDDSLKGIVKQYRNLEINTYHPKYWGF